MTREELAWAAGFYDGEGCTNLRRNFTSRRPSMAPSATTNQIDRAVLDRFQAAVGIGIVRGPYKTPAGRDQWRYCADGYARAVVVIARLWPWLSEVKRAQARAVFTEYLEWQALKRTTYPCGHRRRERGPKGALLRQCPDCLRECNRESRARRKEVPTNEGLSPRS